jgi:hypothetical protein
MGEFGAFAPFDDMIHSRQGEDAPDFGRAVGDAKDSVSTLEFSGSLEDQPQHSRSNVGNILKIAGQVGRLSVELRTNGMLQLLAGDGVEPSSEG